MNCPKCSAPVREGNKFCNKCGCNIELAATVSQESPKPERQQPTCPKCGKELKPESKFCTGCGAVLDFAFGAEATGATEQNFVDAKADVVHPAPVSVLDTPMKKRKLWIPVCCALVAVVCVTGFLLLQQRNNTIPVTVASSIAYSDVSSKPETSVPASSEVESSTASSESVPPKIDGLYRVRKSWDDDKTQVGAFAEFENAKKHADDNADEGYKVFDPDGTLVYEPETSSQSPASSPVASAIAERSESIPSAGTSSSVNSESLEIPDGMSRKQFELLKAALLERTQVLTIPEQYNTGSRVAKPGELLCAGLLSTAPGKPVGLLISGYRSDGFIYGEFIYYTKEGKEEEYGQMTAASNEFHLGMAWGDRFRNRYLPYETLCLMTMVTDDTRGSQYDHIYNLGGNEFHIDRFMYNDIERDSNENGMYYLSSFDTSSPSITKIMEGQTKEERRQKLNDERRQWFNESSFNLNESSFQWIVSGSNNNYKVNVNSRKSYEDTLNDLNRYLW